MMDVLGQIGIAAGAVLAVSAVLGLVGRWVARRLLLPWLRETLIEPIEATRHQVTANNHESATPTVPDMLHTLSAQLEAMDTTFAGHLGESATAWGRFERRLRALERREERHKP